MLETVCEHSLVTGDYAPIIGVAFVTKARESAYGYFTDTAIQVIAAGVVIPDTGMMNNACGSGEKSTWSMVIRPSIK